MPDPPPVNLFTRFVLENPYPLFAILALAAIVIGWPALREGLTTRFRLAVAIAVAAAAVLGAGLVVTTSGEQARAVTRRLVAAIAVDSDVVAATDLFAADATLAVGSPRNPGYDRSFIERGVDLATSRYTVEQNIIRSLKGYSISGDEAEVHLGCLTDAGLGLTPSTWVLRFRRDEDGRWLVSRLTCVSIANRAPPSPGGW